jgi:putative ABC transport system permease protein
MPDWSKEIRALLAGLKLDPPRESEIVEEFAQHLGDRYQELLSDGTTVEKAQAAILEELRSGRLDAQLRPLISPAPPSVVPGQPGQRNPLSGLWKDLCYAARVLRLNPGFSIVAILSLMLGIGANTAIFQLLDAIRLRTLPVQAPQQLADVRIINAINGRTGTFRGRISQLTNDMWENLRDHQEAFSSMGAWGEQSLNLSQGGEARYAEAMWVSGRFFETLGVPPALGRLVLPSDDQPGCGSPGIVISDSFWQREFGGGAVLGTKLTLEGHPFEIVGVTPASFFGVEVGRNFDVALPLCAEAIIHAEDPLLKKHHGWWLGAIGRLKPGWTLERATAQLAAISPALFQATLPQEYTQPDRTKYLAFKLGAVPAAAGVSYLRREYEVPLWLLMAISALVLLIACANLANLMLARTHSRQHEMAVRLALGASRGRLFRQLLAESALLGGAGAILGLGLAQLLSRLLVLFLITQENQWSLDLRPDWRVFAFTLGLAILTCILFGLMPALRSARTAPVEAMKATGRAVTSSRERFSVRRGLVVSQVALSLVLVVGALLFVRTFRNLVALDAGFQQDHILFAEIDFSSLKLPVRSRSAYQQELLEKVSAIPGVISAANVAIIPVSGYAWNDVLNFPGPPPPNGDGRISTWSALDTSGPWAPHCWQAGISTKGTALLLLWLQSSPRNLCTNSSMAQILSARLLEWFSTGASLTRSTRSSDW